MPPVLPTVERRWVQMIACAISVWVGLALVVQPGQYTSGTYRIAFGLAGGTPGTTAPAVKIGVVFIVLGVAAFVTRRPIAAAVLVGWYVAWAILIALSVLYGHAQTGWGVVGVWGGIAAMYFTSVWRFGTGRGVEQPWLARRRRRGDG